MDVDSVQRAYRRHAFFYDLYCGALFEPGRRQTIARMDCQPGERVLEVGVGTGLSLPLYKRGVRVVGIDLSEPMLLQAGEKKRAERLDDVSLSVMDAEKMAFEDASFDRVVAMYVASVVPDPARLVAEMRRVCRSEDGLFILNHFLSASPVLRAAENLVAPLSRFVGWRPDFSFDTFARESRLDVVERKPAGRFGYWTLVRARRGEAAPA